MDITTSSIDQGSVLFSRAEDALIMNLSGPWRLRRDVPSVTLLTSELRASPPPRRLRFDTSQLTHWDTGLITFLTQAAEICRAHQIIEEREGLPNGLRRLLELSEAVPEKKGARSESSRASFFERVGNASIGYGL